MKRDHFVAKKDPAYLLSTFRLYLTRRCYCRVYIYSSKKGLFANTYWKEKTYAGAYVGNPARNRSKLFGEIHLVIKMIGAGYVAHELSHLAYDWFYANGANSTPEMDSEELAYLMGELNYRFWRKFYKRFKEA